MDILIAILIGIAVLIFVPGADRVFWATLSFVYSGALLILKIIHMVN